MEGGRRREVGGGRRQGLEVWAVCGGAACGTPWVDAKDATSVDPRADDVQEGDRGVVGVAPPESGRDAADGDSQEDNKEDDAGTAGTASRANNAQEDGPEAAGVAPPESYGDGASVAPWANNARENG